MSVSVLVPEWQAFSREFCIIWGQRRGVSAGNGALLGQATSARLCVTLQDARNQLKTPGISYLSFSQAGLVLQILGLGSGFRIL